jgi:hypothetical protein
MAVVVGGSFQGMQGVAFIAAGSPHEPLRERGWGTRRCGVLPQSFLPVEAALCLSGVHQVYHPLPRLCHPQKLLPRALNNHRNAFVM